MSEYAIVQREWLGSGPIASPAVFKNLGRYRTILAVGNVSKVEGSVDNGVTWLDVTTSATLGTGYAIVKDLPFPMYRFTTTSGPVSITAN